jgi:hypothetical protein
MTELEKELLASARDALAVYRWFVDEIGEERDVAAVLTIAAILDARGAGIEQSLDAITDSLPVEPNLK